jgi:glycosyltransferase involved in cell wall biosynthesis
VRIAFYAPLKPPFHAVPSGDRQIARLYIAALERAGHRVEIVSEFRSHTKEAGEQARLAAQGAAEAARVLHDLRARPSAERPDLWFTYHCYYKAPDWLGPVVSRGLNIPYVIAEASHAPKRARGPWAIGHAAAADAIRAADAILAPTQLDMACVLPLLRAPDRVVHVPPFLDATAFLAAGQQRTAHRMRIAAAQGLDAARPWLLVMAMMRDGAKLDSYRLLAQVLSHLSRPDWQLLVVGDGPERGAVEAALAPFADRLRYAGAVAPDETAPFYAASDIYVWPAIHEAYGMAFLEAQACGLSVVAGRVRGVPDVVAENRSGLLAPEGDAMALAALVARLLDDTTLRARLADGARALGAERDLPRAAASIDAILHRAIARHTP